MEIVTSEEKIDYIYRTMKRNHRWSIIWTTFKWLFRLAILWYMYYFFTVGIPAMIDKIVPNIPTLPSIWEDGETPLINDPEKLKELMKLPEVKTLLDSYLNK